MQNAPPLKIWIPVLVIVFCGYMALYISVVNDPDVFLELDQDTETLLKDYVAKQDDSTLTVVVLGTSLVQAGVADEDFFRHAAALRYKRKIRVFKLFGSGGYLEQFTQNSRVFDLLATYPPDLLLIEENLIGYHVMQKKTRNFLMYEKLRSFYAIKKSSPEKAAGIPFQLPVIPQTEDLIRDTVHIDAYVKAAAGRTVRTYAENKSVDPFLQRLTAGGAKIVILNFPRPYPIESGIRSGKYAAQFRQLLQDYQQQFGIRYWSFDQPLPFSCFCDFGHMNREGAAVFSQWVLQKIVSEY
ncbi:hypothetical protein [Niabella hirudinis]|uniref:hypothetical protein n=1 Tax=Niabella hirudinis TaxID=1285929 RepID=UPI003EBE71D8